MNKPAPERRISVLSRRNFIASSAAAPLLAAAHGPTATARPRGIGKVRVTRVHVVEVRNIPTGKGLVLPWDPKKVPQDTRDYVVAQFFTDAGVIGTTMDGDYKLPAGIGKFVQQKAESYFVGKDPFEIEFHNREFFKKVFPEAQPRLKITQRQLMSVT
jgi:hypothetical protein